MPSLTGSLLYACGGAPGYENGFHLYAWGAPRYMDGVFDTARTSGWREEALHKEYFSVPEPPDFVNYPFELRLARRGRSVEPPAELAATEALAAADMVVDTPSAPTASAVCARLRILQAKSSIAITCCAQRSASAR